MEPAENSDRPSPTEAGMPSEFDQPGEPNVACGRRHQDAARIRLCHRRQRGYDLVRRAFDLERHGAVGPAGGIAGYAVPLRDFPRRGTDKSDSHTPRVGSAVAGQLVASVT